MPKTFPAPFSHDHISHMLGTNILVGGCPPVADKRIHPETGWSDFLICVATVLFVAAFFTDVAIPYVLGGVMSSVLSAWLRKRAKRQALIANTDETRLRALISRGASQVFETLYPADWIDALCMLHQHIQHHMYERHLEHVQAYEAERIYGSEAVLPEELRRIRYWVRCVEEHGDELREALAASRETQYLKNRPLHRLAYLRLAKAYQPFLRSSG